jgi:anti-sigma factor RsiW
MNDQLRELLSAYLDGALSEPARREVEARLQNSEEMRRQLADLRAVAEAVRALPKQPAPQDLAARVLLRRSAGETPRRDWVFLPPSLRPAAFALSFGVVALFLWQNAVVREPMVLPAPPAPQLKSASNAPLSQVNVSGPAAGLPAGADEQAASAALGLAAAPSAGPSLIHARAKGRALDEAAVADARDAAAVSDGAMSEQARSARNVEMFGDLERQKKAMGLSNVQALHAAPILEAEPPPAAVVAQSKPHLMAAPHAASIPAPAPAPAEEEAGRPAPDAALVVADARSLASSWVLLGFPNQPPLVDFTSGRAVLMKPSVSRILSVKTTNDAVIVVYRTLGPDEPSDPRNDRFALLPLEPETVRIIDATPR